eukprot:234421_1
MVPFFFFCGGSGSGGGTMVFFLLRLMGMRWEWLRLIWFLLMPLPGIWCIKIILIYLSFFSFCFFFLCASFSFSLDENNDVTFCPIQAMIGFLGGRSLQYVNRCILSLWTRQVFIPSSQIDFPKCGP